MTPQQAEARRRFQNHHEWIGTVVIPKIHIGLLCVIVETTGTVTHFKVVCVLYSRSCDWNVLTSYPNLWFTCMEFCLKVTFIVRAPSYCDFSAWDSFLISFSLKPMKLQLGLKFKHQGHRNLWSQHCWRAGLKRFSRINVPPLSRRVVPIQLGPFSYLMYRVNWSRFKVKQGRCPFGRVVL